MRQFLLARRFSALALAALLWSAPSFADTRDLSAIRIENFGQINDRYFRGAQPQSGDYHALAAIGVRTVIDLQKDGPNEEGSLVKAAGMSFYRIPMTTTDRPATEAISRFLAIVNDPVNQPVYVHCAGGRHRTGTMTAIYRITQEGWTADQAYAEMKKYRFEGFPGHPQLKKFVYDFFSQLKLPVAAATTHQ